MKEKKLRFEETINGNFCQRSDSHTGLNDEDIENFEKEILAALESE